jgi:aspartate-semialdehyde dehydrogenase
MTGAPWGWTERTARCASRSSGATGARRARAAALLAAARHPAARTDCRARAAARSRWRGARATTCVRWSRHGRRGARDLAFLCTPTEISRELAPALRGAACDVIDLSSALRMRADVPLVVPEINAARAAPRRAPDRQPQLHDRDRGAAARP